MKSYQRFIYLFLLLMGFGFIGCKKGELITEEEQLARIAFRALSGQSLDVKKISIDGEFTKPDGASHLFLFNKKASSEVIVYDQQDNIILQQRLSLKRGANVFNVFPKGPLDPTLVVGENPMGNVEDKEGYFQVKILNYNQIISPNGEPIRLAIYKGNLVFDPVTFSETMVFDPDPLVVTGLINNQIPKDFIQLPITTFYKATVLDKDLNPLLINGQKVFVYPRFGLFGSSKNAIIYLPQKDADVIFEEDWMTLVDGLGFELSDIWLKK